MIRPVLYVFSTSKDIKNSISDYIEYIGKYCKGG